MRVVRAPAQRRRRAELESNRASALERNRRLQAMEREAAAEEEHERRERQQEHERQLAERDRRDAAVRQRRYELGQRLTQARQAEESAQLDFEELCEQLALGRADEAAALAARVARDQAAAAREVWERAAGSLDGHPAIIGRR